MCGIAGFSFGDATLLKSMLKCIEHRGPDDEGMFVDKHISIGSRRLKIIDLSARGKQPITNEDGTIYTVFNGEIYNFIEIRKELEKKGHKFKSDTDTEVIVHSYEAYGNECFEKFNGMFAIAIWNSKEKKLILARDRLGKKPLYYYHADKKLIFASELKALLEHDIKKEINECSIYHYLTFGYTPREESIFLDIKKLEPGCFLSFSGDKIQVKSYWKLDFSEKIRKPESFFVREIISRLEEAVKKRLVADVPVGAFLSGGIDSSAITAIIKKFKKDLKTFSIGFEYEQYNESKYAKMMADKFETQHYEKIFYSDDIIKLLPKIIYHFDEPFGDLSAVPTYLVSELARKHVTVSLSGDGGDESFLGYDRYRLYRLLKIQDSLPKIITSPIRNIAEALPNILPSRLKTYLKYGKLNDYQKYMEIESSVKFDDKEKLFIKNVDFEADAKKYFIYHDYLDNASNFDFNNYLVEDILTKVDRASMAASLESRVPILDYKFVEFTASIPSSLKLKNGISKYIFKKALKNILPDTVLNRKKQGFTSPFEIYIKKELKDHLINELSGKNRIYSYINKDYLDKLLKLHYSGQRNYTNIIWAVFILKKWFDKWAPNI